MHLVAVLVLIWQYPSVRCLLGRVIVVILSLVLAISLVFSPHRSLLAYRYRRRRHIQNLKHEQEDKGSFAQTNSRKEQPTNPAAIANHLYFSPTKAEEDGTPSAVVQSAGTFSDNKSQLDPEVNLK